MANRSDDLIRMIESETEKRIEIYHDFAPGTSRCEITPLTTRNLIPAVIFSLILIGIFVWGGVFIFPKYFPG